MVPRILCSVSRLTSDTLSRFTSQTVLDESRCRYLDIGYLGELNQRGYGPIAPHLRNLSSKTGFPLWGYAPFSWLEAIASVSLVKDLSSLYIPMKLS